MASFIFQRQRSSDVTKRYTVRESRMGDGLGRKRQMSSADMQKLTPSTDQYDEDFPRGTDTKAPVLPRDVR